VYDPHKPAEVEIRAWARLVRASKDVIGTIENDLKRAGFPSLYWYDVLLELDGAQGGSLRPSELAKRTPFERHSITRLIDRMEKRHLVERVPCPEDARGTVIRITEKGRELRRAMWPVYSNTIKARFADRLSEGDAEQLARLLQKLKSQA
jgi:DNA-binding MarR family transcriptional regulator